MTPVTKVSTPTAGANDVLYEVRENIGYLTFNRPQSSNSLTFSMYERLAEVCEKVNEERSIKALILTGTGEKAFAAGTDISQFKSVKTGEDAIAYEERIERVLSTLERCRVPTIAAIRGACTGGGAGIASCCDLRLATKNAKIGYPVARTLGNCISLTNYARFISLVGPARVKDMIFRARLIEAPEALAIGLITEMVEDPASLMRRATDMAILVASHAPLTLQATKLALLRLRPTIAAGGGDDLIRMCYTSEDFREGIDAFLGKRPPKWRGR
jgi:enoyl-CoA hydratase